MPKRSEDAEVAVLQDWRDGVDKTLVRIEKKIDDLDKKFAAKWVQTVVAGLVAAILLGFIGVVIAFFIPHKVPTITTTPNTSQSSSASTPSGGSNSTPAANASASSKSDSTTPSDSQTSSSNGGVDVTLPKVP